MEFLFSRELRSTTTLMAIADDSHMRKAAISPRIKSDFRHEAFILATIVIAPLIAVGLSTVSNVGTLEPTLHGPRADTLRIGPSDVDNTLWNRTIQKVIVVGGVDEELVTTVVIVVAAIVAGAVLAGFVLIRKLKIKRSMIKAR